MRAGSLSDKGQFQEHRGFLEPTRPLELDGTRFKSRLCHLLPE